MRLFLLALAGACGAFWLQQQAQLPALHYAVTVVAVGTAAWLLNRRPDRRQPALSFLLWLLTFFLAGFFWAATQAHMSLASRLGERWYGRDIRVEGVIATLTQPGERGTRFVMDVERVLSVGAEVPPKVNIAWYRGWAETDAEIPELLAGQRWRLTVRLREPHGNFNPHGFDTEAWMLENGIRAWGYVREVSTAQLIAPMVWRPGYVVQRLREMIRANLFALLDERPYAGIPVALAVGDQRAISPAQWQVLTRTGTNHLMSISGLHITLVAGLAFALTLRLWRRSAWLTTRISPLRAATLSGLLVALGYAALAGFAIPAQRAICMLAVVAASIWSGWRWPPAAVLGAALLFVLAVDPMAVISAGFWLSFAAVAAILAVSVIRGRRDGVVRGWARVQWTITIVLMPLLLVLFQQVSLVSPVANAIAIPVVSLLVAPLALLLIVIPLEPLALLAHEVVRVCFVVLETLAGLPGAVWQQHAPMVWTLPLAAAGVALIMLPRGFPGRWLGPLLLVPMFAVRPAVPPLGELWVSVLDVGQGLAVVARTTNHTVLFDTGPDYNGWSDAGRNIVVPYLRGEGVAHIDLLVVSHDDLDHSGGSGSVLQALRVNEIVSSGSRGGDGLPQGRQSRCQAGQTWTFDEVRFEMLHPSATSYRDGDIGDNDRSCVLRIESQHGVVLLPADIERRAEAQLLRRGEMDLRADVLVAPHHGSRSSSSERFVGAVKPELAVFAVGHANRYGHPHPLVEARYRAIGATLLRTSDTGAVTFKFRRAGIDTSCWRERKRRYWHGSTK